MGLAAIGNRVEAGDELQRLAALRDLELLDTEFEERFDNLTELARRVFDVPIALISLVDADRQWFKSRQGLDIGGTPRNVSFCTHAIQGQTPMVVTDASRDPRFQDNPLVVGPHHIRFYAGAPLRPVSGHAIGTLCVIDRRRRIFSSDDEAQLLLLAQLVCDEIEARALRRGLARERTARTQVERLVEQQTLELSKACTRAEAADRAKAQFLNNMGHELRTPLNAIIGFTDLMLSGAVGTCSDRQRQYLQHIESSGKRLIEVFNQVLQMSQLELGDVKLEIEPLDIQDIVHSLADGLRTRAEKRRVTLSCMVDMDLPLVAADLRAIRRVLSNVIDNAVKFTPDHGAVAISARAETHGVTVTVEDTGEGIPQDKLSVVCEPFSQVDQGLARRFEGAGLGLAIAKGLIEAQHGSLNIASARGEGTRVTITLPFAEERAAGLPQA